MGRVDVVTRMADEETMMIATEAWQIAVVSVASVGALCICGLATFYFSRRCRSAQQSQSNKEAIHKVAVGTNAANTNAVVLGEPVVCVATTKVQDQENV